MNRVDEKVIIVTGGGSGIGRASCELLAKAGAKVIATDINVAAVNETVDQIVASGDKAVAIEHDATSEADWKKVITFAVENYGALDVLVNNVGGCVLGELKDATESDWRKTMAVNLDSTFLGTREGINTMLSNKKGGSIINISSIAGLIEETSPVAYCSAKGGVRMLSKAAAAEARRKRYNIRINSIYPGGIKTDGKLQYGIDEALMDRQVKEGVMGEAIDIARGVLFLASDDSSFINGSELVIDGGATTTILNPTSGTLDL